MSFTKKATLESEPSLLQSVPDYQHNATLVKDIKVSDKRVRMFKQKAKLLIPTLNKIYSTLGADQGFEMCADGYASGSITTIANMDVVIPISVIRNGSWLTGKWPGSTQVYPVLTFFSVAPQAIPTALGAISVSYIDASGIIAPLGVFTSNDSLVLPQIEIIIPSSITDPGQIKIGSLLFRLNGVTPDVATYYYQIAFSAAYVLPASKGYRVEEYDHIMEENDVFEKPS